MQIFLLKLKQKIQMIEKACKYFEKLNLKKKLAADAGFLSETVLEFPENKEAEAYIPDKISDKEI